MVGGAMAAITAVFSVIALLLSAWAAKAPTRAKEDVDEATQQSRQDIASGNADAIAVRVDGLLADQAGTPGDTSRIESAEDLERRISQL